MKSNKTLYVILGLGVLLLGVNAFLLLNNKGKEDIDNKSSTSTAKTELTANNQSNDADKETAKADLEAAAAKLQAQLNGKTDPKKEEDDRPEINVHDYPPTTITFDNPVHDFGVLQQYQELDHIFKFTNTGDNPLIIAKATGSCGCTVPDYPKDPVPPGESGEIHVHFKTGLKKGDHNQTVLITANTEPIGTKLKINSFVEENKDKGPKVLK